MNIQLAGFFRYMLKFLTKIKVGKFHILKF